MKSELERSYHQKASTRVPSKGQSPWRNAQLQSTVIALLAPQPIAPLVAIVPGVIGAAMATVAATLHPIRQGVAAPIAEVEEDLPAAVRGRVGLALVRPSFTHLLRWCPSHRSAKQLRLRRRRSQICAIASFVTPGMIGTDLPNNCMTSLRQRESRYGSARRTLVLVFR